MSYARGSNIAKHAWSSNHSIDLKNSRVIDKGFDFCRATFANQKKFTLNGEDIFALSSSLQYKKKTSIHIDKQKLAVLALFRSLQQKYHLHALTKKKHHWKA